eukprot:m.1312235 g.1312235  ORF g.1312235 m.1312235 type:complete len:194 (-) comp24829_c1_seq79:2537-3118(-)
MACPLASDKDYYKSSGGKIPLRWCAPECIYFRRYSTWSDVWAVAVTMWEVFSDGEVPFAGMPNVVLARQIQMGLRLAPPPGTPARVYDIWIRCWNDTANKRLAMTIVRAELETIVLEQDLEPVSSRLSAGSLGGMYIPPGGHYAPKEEGVCLAMHVYAPLHVCNSCCVGASVYMSFLCLVATDIVWVPLQPFL